MCKAIEAYGEKQRLEEKIETAKNLKAMGMDVSFIAKALKVKDELVKTWFRSTNPN